MNVVEVEVVILDYNRVSKKRVHRDDRLNSWLTWSEDYCPVVETGWWVETLWTLQLFHKPRQFCSTEKQLDGLNFFFVFRLENPNLASFRTLQLFSVGCFNRNPSQFTQDWLEILIREEFPPVAGGYLNITTVENLTWLSPLHLLRWQHQATWDLCWQRTCSNA